MITAGLLSAAGMLLLLLKLGPRKVIGLDIYIDVFITMLLMYLFAGTYSGMLAAIVGGLTVTVVLFTTKAFVSHEVPYLARVSRFPYRSVRWRRVTRLL
jgi:membrane protein CcdC involved in cytochrome C biogenesis